MKVFAMTSGEIEYTQTVIDALNKNSAGTKFPLVPFEDSTYIFYFMFILAMPIALVNLLVSNFFFFLPVSKPPPNKESFNFTWTLRSFF